MNHNLLFKIYSYTGDECFIYFAGKIYFNVAFQKCGYLTGNEAFSGAGTGISAVYLLRESHLQVRHATRKKQCCCRFIPICEVTGDVSEYCFCFINNDSFMKAMYTCSCNNMDVGRTKIQGVWFCCYLMPVVFNFILV